MKNKYHEIGTDDFERLLPQALGEPVCGLSVVGHVGRLYSRLWTLEAQTPGGPRRVIAKAWSNTGAFEQQLNVLRMAKETFAGRQDVTIPYLDCCESKRLLFMPQVHDPTLARLCQYSFDESPRQWAMRLRQAAFDAGRWLRDWHSATAITAPAAPALTGYFKNREAPLKLLKPDQKDKFESLIDSLGKEPSCVAHADYTPLNVMWSPGRIAVIDFGLPEFSRVTPCWDYVSMQLGLISMLRYAPKSPGWWIPGIASMAVNAFRAGYGDVAGSVGALRACLAIRHLVHYAADRRNGPRYWRRARWHRQALARAIDPSDRQPTGLASGETRNRAARTVESRR